MNKKGVSPVVAAVLLIMLVVIIAIIVLLWARGFISESIQKNDRPADEVCNDINFLVQESPENTLTFVNQGNIVINSFKIKITEDDGSSRLEEITNQELGGAGLLPVGSKDVELDLSGAYEVLIIPKILGLNQDGQNSIYECGEDVGYKL